MAGTTTFYGNTVLAHDPDYGQIDISTDTVDTYGYNGQVVNQRVAQKKTTVRGRYGDYTMTKVADDLARNTQRYSFDVTEAVYARVPFPMARGYERLEVMVVVDKWQFDARHMADLGAYLAGQLDSHVDAAFNRGMEAVERITVDYGVSLMDYRYAPVVRIRDSEVDIDDFAREDSLRRTMEKRMAQTFEDAIFGRTYTPPLTAGEQESLNKIAAAGRLKQEEAELDEYAELLAENIIAAEPTGPSLVGSW